MSFVCSSLLCHTKAINLAVRVDINNIKISPDYDCSQIMAGICCVGLNDSFLEHINEYFFVECRTVTPTCISATSGNIFPFNDSVHFHMQRKQAAHNHKGV